MGGGEGDKEGRVEMESDQGRKTQNEGGRLKMACGTIQMKQILKDIVWLPDNESSSVLNSLSHLIQNFEHFLWVQTTGPQLDPEVET